ncbi:flagellar type III secretion system pore protein FliP [Hippea jasoniae]|uniref:flagellar type III secretion system pore protein FliP n=1 Tax=Hippea jasoniae TaxID=944479 RepID=UPI0009FF102A|nr:flagellar type III secretion system pore protein FliP [Hippea jasoniae]
MKKTISFAIIFTAILIPSIVFSQNVVAPSLNITLPATNNPTTIATSIKLLVILTVLALAPSILIMMTSFTRIIIVLAILRQALGTQQMPPNQILIGIALFLTFFIMTPQINAIYYNAYLPLEKNQITLQEAYYRATTPLKTFMLKQTRQKDIALFLRIAHKKNPKNPQSLSMGILIPAFLVSELKTAFEIGFLIYIPFLIIDMVVSSILMSMGMMMLPPIMISLPFKLLIFVLADGWNLVVMSLFKSFMR